MSQEDRLAALHIGGRYDECIAEKHYNYFGDRGVVDLVAIRRSDDWAKDDMMLFEFKSESAVLQATGANEILRQYNRQREYFFKGTEYIEGNYDVSHRLVFYLTPRTYQHVIGNWDVYRTAETDESKVLMQHPDSKDWVFPRSGGVLHNMSNVETFAAAGMDESDYTEVDA